MMVRSNYWLVNVIIKLSLLLFPSIFIYSFSANLRPCKTNQSSFSNLDIDMRMMDTIRVQNGNDGSATKMSGTTEIFRFWC